MTKEELMNRVNELEQQIAANPTKDAPKAGELWSVGLPTDRKFKARIDDVIIYPGYATVYFVINSKAVIYCKARDNNGRVIEDSELLPRWSNIIPVEMENIRKNKVKLGIAKLMLLDFNRCSREVMSVFIGNWAEFTTKVNHSGEEFTDKQGNVVTREHDSSTNSIVSATISPEDKLEAVDFIYKKNAKLVATKK